MRIYLHTFGCKANQYDTEFVRQSLEAAGAVTVESPEEADVAIVKSVNDPTPNEGDLITYTLLVTNNGPSQASNVVVTDSLQPGLTFVRFVPTTLPCVFADPTSFGRSCGGFCEPRRSTTSA